MHIECQAASNGIPVAAGIMASSIRGRHRSAYAPHDGTHVNHKTVFISRAQTDTAFVEHLATFLGNHELNPIAAT